MTSASPQSHRSPSVPAPTNLARRDPAATSNGGPASSQKPLSNGKMHPSIVRPPLRSNFDLEPNPFEQSFSSTSAVSIKTLNSDGTTTTTTQRGPAGPGGDSDHSIHRDADANAQDHAQLSADRPSSDDSKPILPPLASIVSPASPFGGWGMGNSLRAGPLSPAMLTGPANQTSLGLGTFDSSFVRTGLTPDVSRTGFTPLIAGGGAFPPPTPNTAALFAIVNGTSASQPLSTTAAITPNTLNALNGVLNGTLAVGTTAVPLDAAPNGAGAHLGAPYDGSMRHDANGRANGAAGAYGGYQPDNYADTAAASALYLLSQQNAIRPQAQIAPSALSSSHDPSQQPLPQGNDPNGEQEEGTRRGKRKSMDTPAAPTTRGGKKAKASVSAVAPTSAASAPTVRASTRRRPTRAGTDDLDDDDMDDDDADQTYTGIGVVPSSTVTNGRATTGGSTGGKAAQKKPETEEEKRRNFLERNRQAALKCRQRKKKWLQDLQAKVEFLTTENERLTNALIASREEIARLSQLVVAHGGAPSNLTAAGELPPSAASQQQQQQQQQQAQGGGPPHLSSQPVSVNVSLPGGVSKPLPAAVPLPSSVGHPAHQASQSVVVGRGYGY